MKENRLFCAKDAWRGRKAYKLGNGLIELVTLTGGGHVAKFRFAVGIGLPTVNPLWTPPWKTIAPHRYRAKEHASRYGTISEGKLLSGIAGHSLCLDYFGTPSLQEAEQGLSQHGEAPNSEWKFAGGRVRRGYAKLDLSLSLPIAGLRFKREITIHRNSPIACFKETVTNEKKRDHFFHWIEHVTFGPPFLSSRESVVSVPGSRGITLSETKSLLAPGRAFRWPFAPSRSGGDVNLELVFLRKGLGFVASVLVDPRRDWGYVAALNTKYRLLVGYCFRREDFPWVTVWEENRSASSVPWRKRTEARGLEFGTTPLPSTRRDMFRQGAHYDTETSTYVPARGRKIVEYFAFLIQVPAGIKQIHDVRHTKKEVLIVGDTDEVVARLSLPTSG